METEVTPQTPPQGETVPPTRENYGTTAGANTSAQPNDDSGIEMKEEEIQIFNVSGKGEDDRFHLEDFEKYKGSTKFNPKSFKCGHGQGTIFVSKSPFEILSAQVKILMDKMVSTLPLSRYDHLVDNGGSKVWSKWTAKMAYPWKTHMACPLAGKTCQDVIVILRPAPRRKCSWLTGSCIRMINTPVV